MSDGILLTGKRGAGKSLIAVSRIRERLQEGCMVATNLNLNVERLVSPRNKVRPFRLPDWPSAEDFAVLPLGNPGLVWDGEQIKMLPTFDEKKNGLLVLDELATFLNSRTWQGNGRQELINWLLQSRKFGWDLMFLAQHPRLVDAQVRDSLFDLVGVVRRLDKIAVPFLGKFASLVGLKLKMPRLHVAALKYGLHQDSPIAERIWCRGSDLFLTYDTTQKIDPNVGVPTGCGYQYLSGWDLRGRYMGWWELNKGLVIFLLCIGIFFGWGVARIFDRFPHDTIKAQVSKQPIEEKYSANVYATGYFREGRTYRVVLSDNRIVVPDAFSETASGWKVKVGDLWYRGNEK